MKNKDTPEEWKLLIQKMRMAAKERRIRNCEISQTTGIKEPNITRFFSLKCSPQLDTFLKIGAAVGVKTDIFLNKD